MADLTALQGYMRDWLATSTTRLSNSAATQMLNMAQRDILRSHDLWFAETAQTFALVAGTQSYPAPTSPIFSRPISFDYTDPDHSNVLVELDEIPFEEYRTKYGTGTASFPRGDPVEYAVLRNELWFGPTPDRNITANIFYYGVFVDLSAGTDFNNLTVYGWELLLFTALAYASRYMMEDERAEMFEGFAKKQLSLINAEHERRRWSAKRSPAMSEPT